MPVVGGYEMHLYCDIVDCPNSGTGYERTVPVVYLGETFSEAAKEARKHGWRVIRKTRECYCPDHHQPWKNRSKTT